MGESGFGGAPAIAAPGGAPFDLHTEIGRDLGAVDWAAGPLGQPQTWPASLRNTIRLMLGSRFPMWMAWGRELTFFCNDAYRRDTLGAKYPWALGKPARMVWSEIWDDIGPRVQAVTTEGRSTWDEALLLFLERSGYVEETYHTFSYSPLTDDAGEISGLFCVVSEDTDRVVAERRMAMLRDVGAGLADANTTGEVNARARDQLATGHPDLPFVLLYGLDADGRTAQLTWSAGMPADHPAAARVLDLADRESDHASPWAHAYPADGVARTVDDLARHFPDLPCGAWDEPPVRALSVPLSRTGAPGPYGFLIVGLNRYRPLDGGYLGFVDLLVAQIDASLSRARAFEAERDRVAALAELDQTKTTFFTNISHELRTPLTLLLGPSEDALADPVEPLPPQQRARMQVIQRNAERLLKLVNVLLDFSRLESGRSQARYELLDVARYTAELASMFDSAARRAGLELRVDCPPTPQAVWVDREMWAKIVLNLVSNSLKATFDGAITVRVSAEPAGVRLDVADTGTGIAPADQGHLFERFHRVPGARQRTHEGSGIGLALVAELVALHGGTVGVESEVGVGSTFTVRLPYGYAHLPGDQVSERAAPGDAEAARDSAALYSAAYRAEALRWLDAGDLTRLGDPGYDDRAPDDRAPDDGDRTPTERPRVLVVDDNADMRDYVVGLLADDYLVDSAADGKSALGQIAARLPDLVLTDVMMPELDGFGLLASLRADPATMHLPVIMLSARSGDEATVEGLEAGADDYLVKPFSARELIARVRANLELDRARRVAAELERSRSLLAHAEQLAHMGSWEVDLSDNSVRGSAGYAQLLGVTPEFLAEGGLRAAMRLMPYADSRAAQAIFAKAVTDNLPIDFETTVRQPDGTLLLVRVRASVEHDADGVPSYLRGSTQDITEQRRAELEVSAAAAERRVAAHEHAIAEELQRSLLPAGSFDTDHLDIATFYRAGVEGTQVGGDWYDVIELDAGSTALVLGDVMGRGVRAAAVMGQLRATTQAYARLNLTPSEILRLLDAAVREISSDTIVTCVYAVYDPADRTLTYANAGHLPPLLHLPGSAVSRLSVGGPPLGTGATGLRDTTVDLPSGATLTLYTDGLVEHRGSDLDVGIDRLAALLDATLGDGLHPDAPVPHGTLANSPAGGTAQLPDALVAALLPDGPDDDVALLIATVATRSREDHFVSYNVDAGSDAVRAARDFAVRTLEQWGVSDDARFDVRLIVSELISNAVVHGAPPIELRLRLSGERLLIDVRDCATGAPSLRPADPSAENGRGLRIVAGLSARWGTRRLPNGKSVWCELRVASSADTR